VAIALVEHLGDIVAAEPVARAVREMYRDAWIVWVCRPAFLELVDHHPAVDEVMTVRCLSEWLHLRRARRPLFDRVIDLHVPGRFCEVCNQRLVKSAADGLDVTNYYRHGSLLQIACKSAGLPPVEGPPRVFVPESARVRVDELSLPPRFCCVHTRSNQEERDWRDDGWEELAARAPEALGVPVVEVGLAAGITAAPGGYRSLCGRLSMLETAEVIRRAALFIGIDSGPAHLANATGTPGVVLLGQYRSYDRYMPYSGGYADGSQATVLQAAGPASTLAVSTVLAAAKDRLALSREPAAAGSGAA
jgi:ADP-heptose:LPS heptosyltransferase